MSHFWNSLCFEPVLSEKGSIAYTPDISLDESCYREIEQVDILLLILGGRYGSERSFGESDKEKKAKKEFYDKYDSITREEFRAAIRDNISTYIMIERAVYAEYQTFVKNRDSTGIKYSHVDSANIFLMIGEIISLPRNNPIRPFERYHEIETWLREQWASLFKELLRRASNQEQISSIAEQVAQLSETNKTLRKYIESLMTHVDPESKALITSESKRLKEAKSYSKIRTNEFVRFGMREGLGLDEIGEFITESKSIKQLFGKLQERIEGERALCISLPIAFSRTSFKNCSTTS